MTVRTQNVQLAEATWANDGLLSLHMPRDLTCFERASENISPYLTSIRPQRQLSDGAHRPSKIVDYMVPQTYLEHGHVDELAGTEALVSGDAEKVCLGLIKGGLGTHLFEQVAELASNADHKLGDAQTHVGTGLELSRHLP